MSKLRTVKRIIVAVIIIFIGMAGIFYIGLKIKLNEFSKEVTKIEINEIDLSKIEDGNYIGKYFFNDSVGATVEVVVKDNKIINISFIEHKYGKGKKAEAITELVIQEQSLDVDAITGATGSSIVILKAIENALIK